MAAVVTFPFSLPPVAGAPSHGRRRRAAGALSVVQALPDPARRVVTLRFVYGLSPAGIAAQLRITEDEVVRLLAQGLQAVATDPEGVRQAG